VRALCEAAESDKPVIRLAGSQPWLCCSALDSLLRGSAGSWSRANGAACSDDAALCLPAAACNLCAGAQRTLGDCWREDATQRVQEWQGQVAAAESALAARRAAAGCPAPPRPGPGPDGSSGAGPGPRPADDDSGNKTFVTVAIVLGCLAAVGALVFVVVRRRQQRQQQLQGAQSIQNNNNYRWMPLGSVPAPAQR
jgi:hypothetical protein